VKIQWKKYKVSQVFIRSKSSGFDVIVMQNKDDGWNRTKSSSNFIISVYTDNR